MYSSIKVSSPGYAKYLPSPDKSIILAMINVTSYIVTGKLEDLFPRLKADGRQSGVVREINYLVQ